MSERRYRKVVDRFQHKLIVRMVLYWFIYQVTLWNFLFCWRLLQQGRGNLLQQYNQFFWEFYPMLFCFLILVPVFAWDAVKFYHRIAGPIYRFRVTARQIAAGEPVRHVKLRQGDELAKMEEDFNAMIDTLARNGGLTLIDQQKAKQENDADKGMAVVACAPYTEDGSHATA